MSHRITYYRMLRYNVNKPYMNNPYFVRHIALWLRDFTYLKTNVKVKK